MKPNFVWHAGLLLAATALSGCFLRPGQPLFEGDLAYFVRQATTVEYSDVEQAAEDFNTTVDAESPPLTVVDEKPAGYRDLTLEQAIQTALANSQVLRELGGAVIQQPAAMRTAYDPGIQNSDPRFGVEAALSNFDALWHSSVLVDKNDRALNNQFFGGGTRLFTQDLAVFQSQLSKRSATGGEFFLRRNTEYDANNAPGNLFGSAWTANIEAEIRHPLLQGYGVEFNRLAGPSQQPGVFNGVVLARIDTETSLVEFELALRDVVSNVENAYWDLYYAYRDLHAKIEARNQSLKTWHTVRGYLAAGRIQAEKEALAREQYFRLQLEVQNALTGRLFEGTRTANGSSGGTFRRGGGVHVAERRLRLILGLPINDGQLIRPLDEPVLARAVFDWPSTTTEALMRRGELRRQRQIIRRRELELIASRNFLLPRLDAVTRYRWRGFGKDLISANGNKPQFDNAWQDLLNGDFQEFQFGFELDMPIGFRRAHAGVYQAELRVARERAILAEQERQILHDLSNAVAEAERSYAAAKTAFNQRAAAREQLAAVQAAFEGDKATADQVLDAQRRLAEDESGYHLALVEYALAVKNVHFEKGALMDYNQIVLAEGAWPGADESPPQARVQPAEINYLAESSPATQSVLRRAEGAPPIPSSAAGENSPAPVRPVDFEGPLADALSPLDSPPASDTASAANGSPPSALPPNARVPFNTRAALPQPHRLPPVEE